MKEIVFIIIGSILTQSVQEVAKDEKVKEKVETFKEIRIQKKEQRLLRRIKRIEKKLQKTKKIN